MAEDRRRAPRVDIPKPVSGHSLANEGEVVVIQMSLGGMAVESSFQMAVGSRREFRLRLGDGATVHLVGCVRHCRDVTAEEGPPKYVSGVELVDEDPDDGQLPVTDLINRLR
jgi:hypothetical protein